MLLSLCSCDILLHALCRLSNYNTHVNEAARDNPFCGVLHIRACLLARLWGELYGCGPQGPPPVRSCLRGLSSSRSWAGRCSATQDWASLRAVSWGIHLPPSQPHHLDALPQFRLPSGGTLKPADGQELCVRACACLPCECIPQTHTKPREREDTSTDIFLTREHEHPLMWRVRHPMSSPCHPSPSPKRPQPDRGRNHEAITWVTNLLSLHSCSGAFS